MHGPDSVRRSGYMVATVFALIAMFAWMMGNFWTGAAMAFAGMGIVGAVEYLAERSWRAQGIIPER